MLRVFSFCVAVSLFACVATAQPAIDPNAPPIQPVAELPYDLLDLWDVKCYEYLEDRQARVHTTASVVRVFRPTRIAVVLTSTWRDDGQVHILDDWPVRGQTRRLQERIYAEQNKWLTVNRIHVLTSLHHIMGVREGEVMNYSIDGAPGSEPMPTRSLTLATLMRIVTLLPPDAGRRFDLREIFHIPQMELSDEALPIICHGPETILLRGVEQDTTRFSYNGYTAWVRNVDRVLIRLEMPGRRYLELLKDGNCCSADRLRDFIDDIREARGDTVVEPVPAAPIGPAVPAAPADPVVPADPF